MTIETPRPPVDFNPDETETERYIRTHTYRYTLLLDDRLDEIGRFFIPPWLDFVTPLYAQNARCSLVIDEFDSGCMLS